MKVTITSIPTWPAKLVLGLFISLTIASSCADPSNIGLELDPNNNQIGVFYQEIPLTANVVLQDSFSTTNTQYLVFGHDESEFFGKTEAIGYSRLLFNSDIALPEETAVLDSVKFNFRVVSVSGQELSTPKTFNVHLLQEQIQDVQYYNFDGLNYDPEPVFGASFDFSAKQDTVVSLMVDNEFSASVFSQMKSGAAFSDIFTFRNFLPGIVLKGEESEKASYSVGVGPNSGLVFYYRNDESDTLSKAYPITTGTASNAARHFSQVINDPTGTPTEIVNKRGEAFDVGALVGSKATLGLLIKLDTSPLDAFLDTLQNITFNQVSLEMGRLESNAATNPPPPFQIMYFTNETDRILINKDGNVMAVHPDGQLQVDPVSNEPYFSTPFNPARLTHVAVDNEYRQFLTSHLNALYRKSIPRYDYLLYPVGVNNADEFRRNLREYVVNQNAIKFKIFYSKTQAF